MENKNKATVAEVTEGKEKTKTNKTDKKNKRIYSILSYVLVFVLGLGVMGFLGNTTDTMAQDTNANSDTDVMEEEVKNAVGEGVYAVNKEDVTDEDDIVGVVAEEDEKHVVDGEVDEDAEYVYVKRTYKDVVEIRETGKKVYVFSDGQEFTDEYENNLTDLEWE